MRLHHLVKGGLSRSSSSDGARQKSMNLIEQPSVDVDAMTATATICTDIVDHQREVILASGVRQNHYMNNPTVLYEHGENITFDHPLAYSEDDQGDYTVWLDGEFIIEGTAHFAKVGQCFPVVYQYFGLIDLGVLRATSIHVQPLPGGLAVYRDSEGGKYQVTENSDMIEWSWCKIGVNPEALKKAKRFGSKLDPLFSDAMVRAATLQADLAANVLRRDSIGGEKLLDPIKKSLLEITRTGSSQTLKGSVMARKTLSLKQVRAMTRSELKETIESKLGEYDARTCRQLKSMYSQIQEEEGDEKPEARHGDGEGKESDKPVPSGDKPEGEAKPPAPKPEGEAKPAPEKEPAPEGKPVAAGADQEAVKPAPKPGEVAPPAPAQEAPPAAPPAAAPPATAPKPVMDFGGEVPLGSSILSQLYEALAYLLDNAEGALKPVENPDVKGGMGEIMTQARAIQAAVDGLHANAYGTSFAQPEPQPEEGQLFGKLKSFLARKESQVENFQFLGYEGQLRRFSQRSDVPEPVRKSLSMMSQGLGAIRKSAEGSLSDAVSKSQYEAIVSQRDAAMAERDAATEQLTKAMDWLEKVAPASV